MVDGRGGTLSGSSLVYFEVNASPSLGRCTFKPDSGGVEMTTVFTVYCFGWTDLVSTLCVCVCACVRACARACVRACGHACARMCV